MNDTSSKILFILAVIGGLIGFHYYTDYKIDKRINDPDFLNELSAKVRPALIFDANESIHADMGAGDLIEKIIVTKKPSQYDGFFDLQLVVIPQKHLAYPPIIESIDSFEFSQKTNRGPKKQWIYELKQYACTYCEETPLFRLEILKTHN